MPPADVKLGRLPVKEDDRNLLAASYMAPTAPPPSVDWISGISSWPMLGNDTVGDCTCAAQGHDVHEWTQNASATPVVLRAEDVLVAYSDLTGYDPKQTDAQGNNPTDAGASCLDALNHFRKVGVGDHKIVAFVQVDLKNHDEVKRAIELFGNVYCGVALPVTAQGQASWEVIGDPASDPGAQPGSWGGHCISAMAYDAGHLRCVSWGEVIPLSWQFWSAYVEEAYALLSADWINAKGVDPQGFDINQLQADLQHLTNPPNVPGDNPQPQPPPNPQPQPQPAPVPPAPSPPVGPTPPAPTPTPSPDVRAVMERVVHGTALALQHLESVARDVQVLRGMLHTGHTHLTSLTEGETMSDQEPQESQAPEEPDQSVQVDVDVTNEPASTEPAGDAGDDVPPAES